MAKKTARAVKPSQQKSKEEQWRKRMAAQSGQRPGAGLYPSSARAGSAVAEPEDMTEAYPDGTAEETTMASTATTAAPQRAGVYPSRSTSAATTATVRPASGSAAGATAQQRRAALAAQRNNTRSRLAGANQMSVEDEMHFIRHDIRKLVILTVSCLAILIVLAFIIPSIVK